MKCPENHILNSIKRIGRKQEMSRCCVLRNSFRVMILSKFRQVTEDSSLYSRLIIKTTMTMISKKMSLRSKREKIFK